MCDSGASATNVQGYCNSTLDMSAPSTGTAESAIPYGGRGICSLRFHAVDGIAAAFVLVLARQLSTLFVVAKHSRWEAAARRTALRTTTAASASRKSSVLATKTRASTWTPT